jgi:hypothetical protein
MRGNKEHIPEKLHDFSDKNMRGNKQIKRLEQSSVIDSRFIWVFFLHLASRMQKGAEPLSPDMAPPNSALQRSYSL